MKHPIKDRYSNFVSGLSPRSRQWGMVGIIAGAGVGLLWVVFSMADSQPKATTTAAASRAGADGSPTNLEVTPGSVITDADGWVGKAGRDVAAIKARDAEQDRVNKETKDASQALAVRLAEMEARLKSNPSTPASVQPTSSAANAASASSPASTSPAKQPAPAAFPPEAKLARQGTLPGDPPPPRSGNGAMPSGAPTDTTPVDGNTGRSQALSMATPSLVRIQVSAPKPSDGPSRATPSEAESGDTFLPVSFTHGTLLGGLDAPTGGQSQSNPHPVLIRLSDNSVLPNKFRAEFKECFVIAAGYGNLSSERAYMRTETLSCVRRDGSTLEVKIQGSVFGEDGKVGVRGKVISKQGQMLANALLAGVVGGIGQGIATSGTTTSSSALGSIQTSNNADAFKSGIGTGVGKALDRLAQYYIKLAEETFPIIEIDAGREIDVVLTKGVLIERGPSLRPSSLASVFPQRLEPSDRYQEVNSDDQ